MPAGAASVVIMPLMNDEDPMTEPEPSGLVDAHMHVWDPARAHYPWLTPDLTILDRAYGIADVEDELAAHDVTRVVLIQAADNVADTLNMFDQATLSGRTSTDRPKKTVNVAGIVGWVHLSSPAQAARLLDSWADQPIVGIRHLIHREDDPDWVLRKDVSAGLELLVERGLAFDVCAESLELLARVPVLAERHPGLRLVIDHLAKPPIASVGWQPWADLLSESAAAPNVTAKISGLNTAAVPGWTSTDLQPYVDHARRDQRRPHRLAAAPGPDTGAGQVRTQSAALPAPSRARQTHQRRATPAAADPLELAMGRSGRQRIREGRRDPGTRLSDQDHPRPTDQGPTENRHPEAPPGPSPYPPSGFVTTTHPDELNDSNQESHE